MYVPEGERMAMVNRWAPWWLSVQDIGGGHIGYMNTEEFEALPADLQPLVRHLCPEVEDTAQEPMVERAKAAGDRAGWGFAQQEEDPASVYTQNSHVRVPLPEPIKWSQPKRYWGPKLQSTPLDAANARL